MDDIGLLGILAIMMLPMIVGGITLVYSVKWSEKAGTMFKKIGFWIYDFYRFFFDLKVNPLRHIPNPFTQFILMFYLSVMWTAIFTIWVGQTIFLASVVLPLIC